MAGEPMSGPVQISLKFQSGRKTDVRSQFAALCYRIVEGEVEVCLVTSRRTKRWILPKGWPMHKQTPADAAAIEAYEEAGLKGTPKDTCLGVYSYVKRLKTGDIPVIVLVYPVLVTEILAEWPEREQRIRKWFSPKKAAKKVDEPELKAILRSFDPLHVSR
jgi:8-oxo-dGTP pyrophosphatase MutT (NUDIX family)